MQSAGMAELADAPDLGSGVNRRAGSTPVTRILKRGETAESYDAAVFCFTGKRSYLMK